MSDQDLRRMIGARQVGGRVHQVLDIAGRVMTS